jgi:hypothetical protein
VVIWYYQQENYMLIQLTGSTADDYRGWLQSYRNLTGKEPTALERTEAFFAARWGTRPFWVFY